MKPCAYTPADKARTSKQTALLELCRGLTVEAYREASEVTGYKERLCGWSTWFLKWLTMRRHRAGSWARDLSRLATVRKKCPPLLLVLQHGSQLFPQVRIILFSMLGHRMVDRFVQDLFFRA